MAKKQISYFKFTPGAVPPAYGQYPNTVALLTANKSFLIEEMNAYITQQIAASQAPFTGYSYTTTRQAKCRRDTGYIIDSIIYDLTYGGNSASYQIASRFYLNSAIQILTPSVEVATYQWLLGKIATNILTNTPYTRLNNVSGATQVTIAGNPAEALGIHGTNVLFNITINAINIGLSSLPTVVAPNPQNGGLAPNTVKLLDDNKRFIQEEVIAYIAYNVANNIAPFAYYTYNAAKCRRDISYMVDAYIHDIASGGNNKTVNYASKYFENGIPQVDGDRQPEVYAHTFLRDLVENYILSNVAFAARQTAVPQVIEPSVPAEVFGATLVSTLANGLIDVLVNGLTALPTKISNRGYVKFPGFYKQKDILLITNTSRNVIMYNFSDPDTAAEVTYDGFYDSDFRAALYGNEKITTVTFDIDTSGMMVTDQIQIFVEGKEQIVHMNNSSSDAMERVKVGIPQSMLDADFEYGLQPTKWQTISMMRNYPSVYEIPGSDLPVSSVVTDASAGTGNIGSSLITVTTVANHGFAVNDVFTIKALAASVKGFSRAEGTFLVASVPSSTTFTYYAKSRVGTSNPTTLSQTYTQLRKAGFYTGASVGTPSFNVYSNGQSGTVTTSLITASGASIIGFTGSAPPAGAPITGTGIPTGSQISSVVGNGGTVTATTLITTAEIGDNTIQVTNTSGITPGLVIDRGDGTSVAVTDITSNTILLSGLLTSQIKGTNETYANIVQSATSGSGSGATFTVSRLGATYQAVIGNNTGNSYVANDTITLPGTSLGGTSPTNNATVTVVTANDLNIPQVLGAVTPGSGGYVDDVNVATAGGTGTGLTVDITTDLGGLVLTAVINTAGKDYTAGDIVTITGGNGDATVQIDTVSPGGEILTFTIAGTPITAPNVTFISAFTINDFTSTSIADASTLNYTSISTLEVTFQTPHGFIPGDSLTIQITSSGSNAQLAAGSYYVEQVPTPTTLRYTARSQGTIANTLTGIVYARPDSYFVHRPYDGGVQLGTGGPAHGSTAIRMSKKYIRYQSGKGVMYNTGALFAPSYDLRSLTATSTAVGATITMATDDTDHGCQVGAQIVITGVQTSGYNGVYTVTSIIDERTLQFIGSQTLGATTAVLGSPCQMAIYKWHGSTVRSGTFDDQNGMFWQYDGQRMAVGKRSSTFQLAGTINLAANSNAVTGTNTRFTQQLAVGDRIVIKGMSHVVSGITSDTALTVTPDYRGVTNVVGGRACKTIDLIIPQESWNLDPLDGSGPSGYNIDVTKMQMIGMQWTWYGAGFVDFMLRGPTGDYTWAHRFRNSNVNAEAYMRTGNQPVRYEVINEGAKGRLSAAMTISQTTVPMSSDDCYWFPTSGIVSIDGELIRFTGNSGTALTGCTRAATMTQFVAGSNRTFSGGAAATHNSGAGVVLVSSTVTPIISHWGSAFMIDGQFDSDRGYLFNYVASGITVSTAKTTAFLIRLAPSVSNAQTGDLGERELLNRAQLLLQNISITSDSGTTGGLVIEGVLNPQNYPTDPTKITWNGLASSAAGGQPSFAQVASGGSVTWGGNFSQTTSTVQGAFTTTLTAKSFAASTQTLTATGFAAVTRTAQAQSFGTLGQSVTALGFANGQPYGNNTYVSAISTARNDFLITNTQYDALTLVPQPGDAVTGANIAANSVISSVTRAYNGGLYTRIVMDRNGSGTSTAGSGNNVPVTITTAYSSTYRSALSTARNDFLISNTDYDTILASTPLAIGDPTSATTYITGGQTVTGFTRSYITINSVAYTRVTLSGVATATSPVAATNGAQNVTVTFTSSVAALYNNAISSTRADFLIPQSQYNGFGGNLKVTDVLSATTYVTGGQTVSSITQNYTTINTTVYARIVMTANGNGNSPAGANPVTVTSTSALTAAYGSALTTGRSDFLVTDTEWNASGILAGDTLSATTFITGGQTVLSVTTGYAVISTVSYTRVVMSANANANSTSGSGNDVTVTVTAAGSRASYTNTNYLFFDSTSWASGGATIGTFLATTVTSFPAGTAVGAISTRTFGATTVYRVSFTQSSNATINAAATITWQFGAAYALPGEQVFSFISLPGGSDSLDLSGLKELTSTSIGGRGTFPNGPDVLAINVYKTSGSNTTSNVIIRWGEAQA